MKLLLSVKKVNNFFVNIIKTFLSLCIAVQVIVVFLGVFYRYILKSPLSWADEFATFLMVYITFFGAYLAINYNSLARIELFIEKFRGTFKLLLSVAGMFIVLLFLGVFCYYGLLLYISPTVQSQVSAAIRLPVGIFYIAIPISMFLMIISVIVIICEMILAYRNGDGKKC